MKRSQKGTSNFSAVLFSMVLALLLAGCGGGGGGAAAPAGGGGTATTTTISGKVTISGTVTKKPTMMAAMLNKARLQQAGKGNKPGTSQGSNLLKALSAVTVTPVPLTSAIVSVYDADKPEWLEPVAIALTDSLDGTYTLSTLINATKNLKADGTAAYINGDPIPTGSYTVIAIKDDPNYGNKKLVAVQAVVKKFAGAVIGNDLVAQDSTAIPTVISMIGLAKNADGTFGSSITSVPVNANIQVTFSGAMARLSVIEGMTIAASSSTTPLAGKWKVSPDLTAVTFYPTNDLSPNTVYTITVGGGKSLKTANNIYGKAIAADVKGSFKSTTADKTQPSVNRNSPTTLTPGGVNSMSITTPIRIGADEELDINSIAVAVTVGPSIGDKPTIKYVGKSTAAADSNYPYIYEIVPSSMLQLGTTYSIGVSGGLDMAGNMMVGTTPINFTTETSSAGISTTGTVTEINAQLSVKDVLGKWVNAMNARNSALLSSYMSGDFYWINDTAKGMSSEDLNRDGRLSLNEFTAMLDNWFKDLDRCGSTVTGDVATLDTHVTGGIAVNGSTATLAFTLTATPTNTTDLTCANGPKNTLYATMENINQAWLMTHGSKTYLATYPAALTPIALVSPANGNQFADPSLTPTQPLTPEFKWTAVASDAAGTPASTYLVVLVDNKSRQLRTGWAALVDGSATAAGSPISAKFNGKPGDYGNMIVLCTDSNSSVSGCGNNPIGFDRMITEVKPGGSYSWAVIGFKTKTLAEFKTLNFDPATYLVASSVNNGFTVNGVWKALTVKVASGTTVYDYSDNSGGYNVGASNSVTLTVTTPNSTTTGYAYVNGYTSTSYPLNYAVGTNGVNTATTTINLSNKRNWVSVGDGSGTGIGTDFGIFTSGGALPKITFTLITAKKCDGVTAATLGIQDAWGTYTTADTCTVSVSGSLDVSITGTLYINVGNNNGIGSYNKQVPLTGTTFNLVDIPVYKGNNWVSISNWNSTTSENNWNGFNVDTLAGSTYTAPITATVATTATLTPTSSDVYQTYYDAGAAASVTLNVTMPSNTGTGGYSFSSDPNWTYHSSGTITVVTTTSFTIPSLYKGWNYINLWDGAGNGYTVNIYTTGGTVYTPPNVVTSITDVPSTVTVTPTAGYGYYQFPATGTTTTCQVAISGTTTSAGNLNVYLNYYNSTSGASVYESQSVTPAGGIYSFTQNVYGGGTNSIDISDASWNWQGVQVTTGCATAPVVFGVTSVKAGTSTLTADVYGTYNTTVPTVTVTGTAKAGTITAYVSGQYYNTYTATAASGIYSIDLPIYTGYNYISLTDGSNWTYVNVSTTTGTAYTPPISGVTVSDVGVAGGATLSSGGGVSDTWSSWNTSLGTVDISGKTVSNVTGTGTYYQSGAIYTSGTFTITSGATNGTFTLPAVALGYGYNYFTLYDANWNSYSLTIYTSGGSGAPVKVVAITSPAQGASASGATTVSGTITTTSFTPVYVYGYVYDYTTGVSTYFSNQATDTWAQPLTYTASTGAFSFSGSVTAGNTTNIEVYAYDINWVSHGHYIYVNNTSGYSDYFWKPGSKASVGSAKAKAHRTEFVKKMMRR